MARNQQPSQIVTQKTERQILKAFLLSHFYHVFCDFFQNKKQFKQTHSMEYYAMDSKIVQFLIQRILETEEYTLEGIARYTHLPFDVVYDAACGISNQFSITPWARIVDLYLKVKPDVAQILINKLLEIKDQNNNSWLSLLLTEV